jgi:hypothetical protein
MKINTLILLVFMTVFLTACAGNITVNPNYQPSTKAATLLASAPAAKIKMLNFEDKRQQQAEAILIGRREAAFGVPMGDVFSERPIFQIIRDATIAEFMRNGHSVVTDHEDISIKGQIRKFWVGTEVTPAYWDVVGEISIVLEVKTPAAENFVLLGPYSSRNVERTYAYPGKEIVTRVLDKSLQSAIHAMSSDSKLLTLLTSKR